MYSTLVKNHICRGSNGFHCILCDIEIIDKENACAHVQNNGNHLEKMEATQSPKHLKISEEKSIELVNNGIVPTSNKQYQCTFCSCPVPKLDHVSEHISGKKHITKRRKILPDSDIKNATNSITSNKQNEHNKESSLHQPPKVRNKKNTEPTCNVPICSAVYCNFCQSNLDTSSALLYHGMFHLSQRSCNITDIISFCIKENLKRIYCLICDSIMSNEEDLEKHLNQIIHQKRLMFLHSSNNAIINMGSMLYPNVMVPPNMNNVYNLSVEYYRYLEYLNYSMYCNSLATQNNHLTVQNNFMDNKISTNMSVIQFQQQNINNAIFPIMQQNDNTIFPAYFCFTCDIKFVNENYLFYHYHYDCMHKTKIETISLILKDKNMKFLSYSNNEFIKCFKCQVQFNELHATLSHICELQHRMEKQFENKIMYNDFPSINDNNFPRYMYTCPICKINMNYDYIMVQHLESVDHKHRVQDYYKNINCESFEKIIFFCSPCKMNFFDDKKLLEHFYLFHESTIKNKIQLKNVFVNSNGIQKNINNFMPSNDINHTLHKLVDLNLDKNQQQKLRTNINRQRTVLNKVSENTSNNKASRTKKLINFSPRYVQLCVEIGDENIFKVNPEKLRKLQLGMSLTFPYGSDRGCIPCRIEISGDPQLLYEHLRTDEHEKNLQEMEDHDEYFENYRDQFSDLELAKSYMHEDSDEWVKCLTCDITIENCTENLSNHINSEIHVNKQQSWKKSTDELFKLFSNMFENLWYYIEKFSCNICCAQFEFEVDYARHLEHPEHLKEVEKRILRKQSLQFDCCIMCSSYWYAKSDHHKIHCSKDSHKYILKSRDFTVPEMNYLAKNILTSVEQTIDNLLAESDKVSLSDKNTEKNLLNSVEMIVLSKYPKAKAYLFGSRISYLGTEDSDLDIYLDCENQYEQNATIDECQEQLLVVQECFHKYQDIWIIEEIILRTRVPIIKLRHRTTNLHCDISFISGLSVEKSKILGYFISAYLPCRKLILYLKKWNVHCQLSGPKGITTFAISWLVIFYLQVKKILPSVHHLIELENHSNIVAGWETGVSKTIPIKETDLPIKELLGGFFTYYAEFNYISDVACPFLGKVMKKRQFSEIDGLPEEMNIYKTQVKEEKVEFFRLDSPMCIQEPIDLSQNITKAITKLHLRMFKQYCAESAAIF